MVDISGYENKMPDPRAIESDQHDLQSALNSQIGRERGKSGSTFPTQALS